jgi:hypothetical protein
MKNIIKLLSDPLQGLDKNTSTPKEVNERFCNIAEELFNNYCIKCGDKEFYLAEVEFYYFESRKWNKNWNDVTYPRNSYKAGDLFYHLSGVDICFDSQYNDDYGKYGGILIRSIRTKDGVIISGPLTCKDKILNACKGCKMLPYLWPKESEGDNHISTIASTYRTLGKILSAEEKESDYKLCFYDNSIPKSKWKTSMVKGFYKKEGTQEREEGEKSRSYNINRFILSE